MNSDSFTKFGFASPPTPGPNTNNLSGHPAWSTGPNYGFFTTSSPSFGFGGASSSSDEKTWARDKQLESLQSQIRYLEKSIESHKDRLQNHRLSGHSTAAAQVEKEIRECEVQLQKAYGTLNVFLESVREGLWGKAPVSTAKDVLLPFKSAGVSSNPASSS